MAFLVGIFAVDGDQSVMELVDIGEFGTSASGFQGWLSPVLSEFCSCLIRARSVVSVQGPASRTPLDSL